MPPLEFGRGHACPRQPRRLTGQECGAVRNESAHEATLARLSATMQAIGFDLRLRHPIFSGLSARVPNGLVHLPKEKLEIARLPVFKNALQQFLGLAGIFAERLRHHVIMRSVFHLAPPAGPVVGHCDFRALIPFSPVPARLRPCRNRAGFPEHDL